MLPTLTAGAVGETRVVLLRRRPPVRTPAGEELSTQFGELVQTASRAGRPFRVPPLLFVVAGGSAAVPVSRRGNDSDGFDGFAGNGDCGTAPAVPVVELSASVAGLAPGERAATMAHELSHLLRAQEGRRPAVPCWQIVTVYVAGAAAAVGALGAVFAGGRTLRLAAAVLAVVGLAGLWLLLQSFRRREETETDLTATVVFGQVLSEAGVARLECAEGRLSRWVPTLVRSHPHPWRRRAAQLR